MKVTGVILTAITTTAIVLLVIWLARKVPYVSTAVNKALAG